MAQRPGPEDILSAYDAGASLFASERDTSGFEAGWLSRAARLAPGASVLDLGCGPGHPIATWLAAREHHITGVDGAPAMTALFAKALPDHTAITADMRNLALGRRFDLILAWNSFFHLSPADQRGMFAIFAAHAAPGAALLFTSGHAAGEAWGYAGGRRVYHASLAPDAYRQCLATAGFAEVAYTPEDPECRGHTIWLTRFIGAATVNGPPPPPPKRSEPL